MSLELYQLTLSAAFVALIFEMLTGTFLFLGLCIGLGVLAVLHYVTQDFSLARDAVVVCAVSAITFLCLRRWLKSPKDSEVARQDVNTY